MPHPLNEGMFDQIEDLFTLYGYESVNGVVDYFVFVQVKYVNGLNLVLG